MFYCDFGYRSWKPHLWMKISKSYALTFYQESYEFEAPKWRTVTLIMYSLVWEKQRSQNKIERCAKGVLWKITCYSWRFWKSWAVLYWEACVEMNAKLHIIAQSTLGVSQINFFCRWTLFTFCFWTTWGIRARVGIVVDMSMIKMTCCNRWGWLLLYDRCVNL